MAVKVYKPTSAGRRDMTGHSFDEITEEGSKGYATLATPDKGKVIFDSAVAGLVQNLTTLFHGYVFKSE